MTKLLTFLGTGSYQESEVFIDDFRTKQKIFPLALVEFFKSQGKDLEVIFFLTRGAYETFQKEQVKEFCESRGISVKIVDISEDEKVADFVKKIIPRVQDGDEVILDVTHSFRMLPMMALIISLYLKELKQIQVKIIYGKYDRDIKTTRCTDITEMSETIDWIYGTKLFTNYGFATQLSELIKKQNEKYYKNNHKKNADRPTKLGILSDDLTKVSESIRLGSIQLIRNSLSKFFKDISDEKLKRDVSEFVPHFAPLFEKLVERYKAFHIENESLILNEEELKSEAELVKFYVQTGDYGMALRLAREYIKNVLLYKMGKHDEFLNISERESLPVKSNVLFDARNHFAHFGFNNLPVSPDKIRAALNDLIEKIENGNLDVFFNEFTPEKNLKAILTPLGTTQGALYTVLKNYNADLLVILTSEEGNKLVDEIVEKSEFRGEVRTIIIKDPFSGVTEIRDILSKAENYLENAREIIVNITGGTTFMTYIIERIRDRIRYGKSIKSVIAFDERPYDEQRKNPYVVGKILEIA
ncbi:CRISPR-associated protein, TM1812 family [Fervidobacterium changbaicum]|uniref:CRISPR-associated DxTHG motif protein n=1 Tax=Fervidobacterium changbaicum TaxID=310769 RepID=A0ABX5QSM4_9BACT|nr:TM1812 family CRISPR-associated protein [Fervidobacterium changbaicum]QAV33178.1 CRISPR-associated DxTHG motif protein [Fervidobacterium changbaicum]SDH70921.1 CRISPR-associated protein, TM1812 family [Fervidobacterium changbaicum]